MPLDGEYVPNSIDWAREQVDEIVAAGTTAAVGDATRRVVLVSYRGRRTGALRRTPLMRVEHQGEYALVASLGGAPTNPEWYSCIVAEPHVELMDGAERRDYTAREVTGAEKELWWERAVAVFPLYAEYQEKTERAIPVFVLHPVG